MLLINNFRTNEEMILYDTGTGDDTKLVYRYDYTISDSTAFHNKYLKCAADFEGLVGREMDIEYYILPLGKILNISAVVHCLLEYIFRP